MIEYNTSIFYDWCVPVKRKYLWFDLIFSIECAISGASVSLTTCKEALAETE